MKETSYNKKGTLSIRVLSTPIRWLYLTNYVRYVFYFIINKMIINSKRRIIKFWKIFI